MCEILKKQYKTFIPKNIYHTIRSISDKKNKNIARSATTINSQTFWTVILTLYKFYIPPIKINVDNNRYCYFILTWKILMWAIKILPLPLKSLTMVLLYIYTHIHYLYSLTINRQCQFTSCKTRWKLEVIKNCLVEKIQME